MNTVHNPPRWSRKKAYLTIILVSALSLTQGIVALGQAESSGLTDDIRGEQDRAIRMARDGKHDTALITLARLRKKAGPGTSIDSDIAVVLSWAGKDKEAVAAYESLPPAEAAKPHVQSAIGDSYRRLKQGQKAETLFRNAIKTDPSGQNAVRSLALVLFDQRKFDAGIAELEAGLKQSPASLSLHYETGLAYWHYKRDYIKALSHLNSALKADPKSKEVVNERSKLLSDMGATAKALEFASANNQLITPKVFEYLLNNLAAQYIRWDEPDEAVSHLTWARSTITRAKGQEKRAWFDRVLAQSELRETKSIIEIYEELLEKKEKVPYWVHDAAGSAYLYEENTEDAIKAYERAIEVQPTRTESRMGLYYALTEEGKFGEAEELRMSVEKESPYYAPKGGLLRYNRSAEEVILNRGWLLAYQDRLDEAEEFFAAYLKKAPANLSIRSALGQIRTWRGHHDEGLEDLQISLAMTHGDESALPEHAEQNEMSARNSLSVALNNAGHKSEARQHNDELLKRNPYNKNTLDGDKSFRIEDRTELLVDAIFEEEDPGIDHSYLFVRLTQPLMPYLAAYAYYLYDDTTDPDDVVGTDADPDADTADAVADVNEGVRHERYGFGLRLDVNSDIRVTADVSEDLNRNDESGRLTVDWDVTDQVDASATYNSFSLNVPLRAKAAGIESEEVSGRLTYRSSELFQAGTYWSLLDHSDNNEQTSFGADVEIQLLTRAHVKSRLFLEANRTENMETNVLYFSPEYTDTFYARVMLEHVISRVRDWAFVHRLHIGTGSLKQADFDGEFIWDARYEHDYRLTDWSALLWGLNFRSTFYDGEGTDILSYYLTYRQNF